MTDLRRRIVQPSALHPSGEFQRRDLPAIDVAFVAGVGGQGPQTGYAEFVMATPEVRCRIRGSLIFVPQLPGVDLISTMWDAGGKFGGSALWLAKRDEATNGSAERVPVENLVGAYGALRPIPDPGCLGFTFDLEVCADEVWGRFLVDSTLMDFPGKWVLRPSAVAYQAMTDVEWNRLLGRFSVRALHAPTLAGYRAT